jgi:hypothetical protein
MGKLTLNLHYIGCRALVLHLRICGERISRGLPGPNRDQVTHTLSKVLRGKSCPGSGILASCVADSAQGFETTEYPHR